MFPALAAWVSLYRALQRRGHRPHVVSRTNAAVTSGATSSSLRAVVVRIGHVHNLLGACVSMFEQFEGPNHVPRAEN